MHEYRRFIQGELDARGWRQSDLVRKSGLSRQLVSQILNDRRDHLGQMPDQSTIEKLARGFGVPVDLVRTAAARSLTNYSDDGTALTITLSDVSTDALLTEIRRRIDHAASHSSAPAPADPPAAAGTQGAEVEKTGAGEAPAAPTDLHARRRPPADPDQYRHVARTRDKRFGPQDPDAYDTPDLPPDPDGPEYGA